MESWKRVIKEVLIITDYLCVGLKVTLISYKNIELEENSYIVDFRISRGLDYYTNIKQYFCNHFKRYWFVGGV